MTGAAPLVSVLMPAYNAQAFIAEGIRSVLAQTLRDVELIVIDDASTDDTAQMVRGFDDPRVVLLQLAQNAGAVGARNAGIEAARGRYIALLDADDLAEPHRLEVQLRLLESSGADVCASRYRNWNTTTGRIKSGHQYEGDADLRALLTVYCPIGNSTVTARAEAFRRFRYDPRFAHAEDYELWMRMAAAGLKFVASPEVLVTYRLHGTQTSVANAARVKAASDAARAEYLARLGIAASLTPRHTPWRERLRIGPAFLAEVGRCFGRVSVKANYESYARFQFRGDGPLAPVTRAERWWAAWTAHRRTPLQAVNPPAA
jgi:glycosyltransferase involved in cell wall biosynthesis